MILYYCWSILRNYRQRINEILFLMVVFEISTEMHNDIICKLLQEWY